MAAIKYEKDRAANTLLPNWNTYGRYDIPSYYESYWQSPEERYYTGKISWPIGCEIIWKNSSTKQFKQFYITFKFKKCTKN